MSRSIENAARQRGARTTPGPDQGPVPSRSPARRGSAFPVHHLRSRRRRPQGAAWALGGQEARERPGGAWRIGAGASIGKQTPAAPIRLAEPGLDATPCLPKPRCNAGSLQGGVGEDGQDRRVETHRRPSRAAMPLPRRAVSACASGRSRHQRARPQAALRFTGSQGGTAYPRGGTHTGPPLPPTPDRHSDETRPAARGSGSRSAGLAHRAGHGVRRVGQVPLRPQAGAGSRLV